MILLDSCEEVSKFPLTIFTIKLNNYIMPKGVETDKKITV
jgi:hypothetical protein